MVAPAVTERGHGFNYFSDATVTSLFFAGVGFGLRDRMLGGWSIALGLAGAAGVAAAEILSERIDQAQKDSGEKASPGIWGFDFDAIASTCSFSSAISSLIYCASKSL